MDEERVTTRTFLLALLAICGLALALRLIGLGSIPSGLYHDEAYNGLDAVQVLRGWRPLWFPANNGREPFFIYLVAASIGLLGRTVAAVRAPALLLGLLTVPATAFLGASLFNRRVGLLAAAVDAVALWAVHLSHVGFRAVALPLFTALALGFLWRGLRHGRRRDYAAAGLLYGASFYTYLAARFTPIPLLLGGLLVLWPAARFPKPDRRGLLLFVAVAAVVVAPLGITMALHPEILLGRTDQVSIFSPAISHGDPWGMLGRDILKALGMFFVQGDRIPRHNLPWRPVFDPILGLAFLGGLWVAVRRREAGWFVLLWVGAMLLPTILAEDTPHFLRSVGILPVVFLLPALGLDAAWSALAKRGRARWGVALVAACLLVGLGSTSYDYFVRFAHDETAYYFFESGSTELATEVNTFLHGGDTTRVRVAWVSERLWRDWPALRFLLPESPNVQVVAPESPPAPPASAEMLLAVWPVEPYGPALDALPTGSALVADTSLMERGDLEPKARQLATVITATEDLTGFGKPVGSEPIATLEHGIHLLAAQVTPISPLKLRVTLVWSAGAPLSTDYNVFVHVRREPAMLGQHDGPPAGGILPTTRWRAGDRVVDVHEIDLQSPYDQKTDRVTVGLYDLATVTRLHLVQAGQPASADSILIATP